METTFPRAMLEHAKARPEAAALREKEFGIWQTLSWSELAALVRAMACGLAVVSADTQSARALVRHEHTGLLCAPDDPGSYVEALASLAAAPDRRIELGAAARAASANYSWAEAAASVALVYEEVVKNRSRAAGRSA